MALKGIDVSNWQGKSFDWAAQAAQGVDFAFIKATEGTTFTDPDFAHNWAVAKVRGLVRGAYHFFHPGQSVESQASWFLSHVHGQGLEPGDLLAVDYEVDDGVNPEAAAAAAGHFVDIVNSSEKVSCVVYTTRGFALCGYCAGLGRSPLWLAVPGATSAPPPPPWTLISFEQTGVRGVDQDAGYFPDLAQLRKLGVQQAQLTIDQALAATIAGEQKAAAAASAGEAAADHLPAAALPPGHAAALQKMHDLAAELKQLAAQLLGIT